jgi:FkbM family methyltransferase
VSAYRLILGREPDPDGLKNFLGFIADGTVPATSLAAMFLESAEYLEIEKRRATAGLRTERVRVLGFELDVAPAWNQISREILENEAYEPHVTREIVKRLKPGMNFVDVGANIGYFTLLACYAGANVWAFEPGQRNLAMLTNNLAINDFAAEVFPTAVADRDRTVVYTTNSGNGLISLGGEVAESQVFLRAVSLDSALKEHKIDMMKIDVEGAEGLVLEGAARTIESLPTIFFELTPSTVLNVSGIPAINVLENLRGRGYSLSVITKRGCTKLEPAEILSRIESSDAPFADLVAEAAEAR